MVTENEETESAPEDIIRLLIATDVHLGHQENDPVRGDDSFVTFEEVLALAEEQRADAVLLGGDLFDAARPSPGALLRATRVLRERVLGDRPVALRLLSDPMHDFGRCVNYEDPDLNVGLPIFTIHGNHDDPVGQGSISSLDILSSMGLVNYFGRWTDYSAVKISPVLLQKGSSRLALYGLGHLKDQRLSRLFKEGKVEMQKPSGDDWFNLMVLHQNRADRGPGNYIQEDVLPDFLDLVVWGHEHDCRVQEEQNNNKKFFVTQPGSTVATSLASGESLPKHCALLQIHKKKFILTPIPLMTVRPFIFKTIVLSEETLEEGSINENDKVQEFLKTKVLEAIEEANKSRSGHPAQPKLPLVRLSVFYERESQDFNRIRFGQNFAGQVANPNDLLIMKREKRIREKKEKSDTLQDEVMPAAGDAPDVESLLLSHFAERPPEHRLALLSARALTDALRDFTEKKDEDAFKAVLRSHRHHALQALAAEAEPDVACVLAATRDSIERDGAAPVPESPPRSPPRAVSPPPATAKSRGRPRGGRGSGPRAAPAPRKPPSPEPAAPRRSTPRRSAALKSTNWLQDMISKRDDSD